VRKSHLRARPFFRPSKDAKYRHIDGLFSDTVDWQLIQDHWPDLLQVALSIKAGTISSAQLLRRLGSYSRRNPLYQAFRELGRVVRTIFLLEFLNDAKLREQITGTTNKVEAYNGFAKWLNFGGEGVIDTMTRSSRRSTSSTTISSPMPRRSRTSSISLAPFAIYRPKATLFAVRIWPNSVPTRLAA
jgi:TnpA family transposase